VIAAALGIFTKDIPVPLWKAMMAQLKAFGLTQALFLQIFFSIIAWPVTLLTVSAQPKEKAVTIARRAEWTTAFGDEAVKVQLAVEVPPSTTGRLLWAVTTLERIALARGEVPIDASREVEFSLQLPTVKPGFVLPALLTANFIVDRQREVSAKYESPLWIYPRDPIHNRLQWLTQLTLTVYDPPGATIACLANTKIPFVQISNISALGETSKGLVLIGEGSSFREDRALPEIIVQLARRGVPVLCLTPSQGDVVIPRRQEGAGASLQGLNFHCHDIIAKLDKHLDTDQWMLQRATPSHTLALCSGGSRVLAEIVTGEEGWTWLEMQFGAPKTSTPQTRLVITSLPVIKHWDDGPTPRYLFVRLLEHVASVSSSSTNQKDPVSP